MLNQKLAKAYLNDNGYAYNENTSVYENLRHLGSQVYTSKFIEQIEHDMRLYRFPEGYEEGSEKLA